MLKSGGDAGSNLFAAASGLKGLNELRKSLDEEAVGIFAPTKAKDRSFYQARDRFEEANKQIRSLELKDRDLRERRAHIERLTGELKAIREKRADAVKRRERLVRQRDIAPLLRLIAADEAELLAWEHLPAMDSSRVLQLRKALDSVDANAAELSRLREDETSAQTLVDALLPDEALLEMGPAH
jgi:chromosome segregation protein